MRRALIVGLVVIAVAWPSGHAAAHPQIDEATRLYEQGELEAALEQLAEAEAGGDLSRRDVLSLLTTRVLIHVGLGNEDAYRRDLAHIAVIDPDYQMGPAFPPLVRQTFAVIREQARPIALDARAEPIAAALKIDVTLEDASELVSQVRISARVSGGPWLREAGTSMEVPAPAGAQVDWYVDAIGPAGLVVASVGSSEAPRRVALPGAPQTEPAGPVEGGEVDEGGSSAWIWIGLGAAVLVGAAVLAYFLFFDDPVGDQTAIDRPRL